MPDVAQKIFSDRVSYNGSAVVTVDKLGGTGVTNVIHPNHSSTEDNPNASGLIAYLDTRFDNPTYYSN